MGSGVCGGVLLFIMDSLFVVGVCLVCDWCVVWVWLVCGWCVIGVWLVCG